VRVLRRESLVLLAVLFGWNLIWAWVALVRWGLIPADAAARTLLAAEVFFSRDPKLSNLGFVWLPLPALLQLPLVLIPGLWPTGLAGATVSALAGAVAGALINDIARALGWSRSRWLLVAAFALNPAVVYVSASGLTEPVLMAAALGLVRCFLGWVDAEAKGSRRLAVAWLVGLGLSGAAGVLTRYEGWVLGAVMALMVGLLALKRSGANAAQAAMLVYAAPPAYAAFLWVFFNWLIMGDPLYFALGPYSARAYVPAGTEGFDPAAGVRAVADAAWRLSPLFFFATVGLLASSLIRWDPVGLLLAAFWLSVPLFVAFSLVSGQLAFIQYRYLTLLIPGTAALVALGLRGGSAHARWRCLVGLLVALLGPLTSLVGVLQEPMSANSVRVFGEALISRKATTLWTSEREMAQYLTAAGGGPILTDTPGGVEMVIFFTGEPGRFIVPGNRDFEVALRDPAAKVAQVLVPAPTGTGALHRLNQAFPELYATGSGWAVLEKEIGPYRLYRVPGARPGRPEPASRSAPQTSDRLRLGGLILLAAATGLVAVGLLRRPGVAGG
jgi:hypothetical protein